MLFISMPFAASGDLYFDGPGAGRRGLCLADYRKGGEGRRGKKGGAPLFSTSAAFEAQDDFMPLSGRLCRRRRPEEKEGRGKEGSFFDFSSAHEAARWWTSGDVTKRGEKAFFDSPYPQFPVFSGASGSLRPKREEKEGKGGEGGKRDRHCSSCVQFIIRTDFETLGAQTSGKAPVSERLFWRGEET